ncbi:MAG: hypothetical protein MJ077_06610 [Oscillospiraceae bacterium]|nr:hypothetical protein [Oscillospiraceae bacterium]
MAATNHTISFVDGKAENIKLPIGTYTYVSNTIPGYSEGGTVNSFTITKDTASLELKITANGELVINVKDDLDAPITAGNVQLSNSNGSVVYGNAADIAEGKATFTHVPYDDINGIGLYIGQAASDDDHDPIGTDTPVSYSMTATPGAVDIMNARKQVEFTLTLSDAFFTGITALNGDLVVNG